MTDLASHSLGLARLPHGANLRHLDLEQLLDRAHAVVEDAAERAGAPRQVKAQRQIVQVAEGDQPDAAAQALLDGAVQCPPHLVQRAAEPVHGAIGDQDGDRGGDHSTNRLGKQNNHHHPATDPDRSTYDAYLRPAAQLGIPKAFIRGKDSRIEWIGHPTAIDDVLAKVVRGTWDRDEFKVAFEKEVAPARKALRLMDAVDAAAKRGDWDAAITAVTALVEDQPEQAGMQTRLFRKMVRAVPARGYVYGNTLITENWDDARVLNGLAWITVDDAQVTTRDLGFALKAAEQACALTDHENPGILDTLARVYFEKGEIKTAIAWQRDALDKAGASSMAGELRETLIKYEKVAASRL